MNYTGNVIVTSNPNPPPEYISTPVAPIEFFGDPNVNTVESDGLSNTMKNGVSWNWRTNIGDLTGDWCYPVRSGDTFTFDFFVDPACVVLNPYPIVRNWWNGVQPYNVYANVLILKKTIFIKPL